MPGTDRAYGANRKRTSTRRVGSSGSRTLVRAACLLLVRWYEKSGTDFAHGAMCLRNAQY
eukprot:1488421-Rhodomonas_salina.2